MRVDDMEYLRNESNTWCLAMTIAAVVMLCTGFSQKSLFGIVGENITKNMRRDLYYNIIRKHVGFFDNHDNSPSVLNTVLANDIQALNGASTEGLAVLMESTFALLAGIAIGFFFSWRIALVALACAPFMMAGGAINAKMQAGMDEQSEEQYKVANLLAGDSIMNYRTIASFGSDESLV